MATRQTARSPTKRFPCMKTVKNDIQKTPHYNSEERDPDYQQWFNELHMSIVAGVRIRYSHPYPKGGEEILWTAHIITIKRVAWIGTVGDIRVSVYTTMAPTISTKIICRSDELCG